MQVIVNDIIHNRQRLAYDQNAGFSIGRDPGNQVVLDKSRFVFPRHLVVDRSGDGWQLTVDAEATAVTVDNVSIEPGQTVLLKPVSEIILPGFCLTLRQQDMQDEKAKQNLPAQDLNRIQREIHQKVIAAMELRREGAQTLQANRSELLKIGIKVDEIISADYNTELGPAGTRRNALLVLAISNRLQHSIGGGHKISDDDYQLPGFNLVLERLAEEYDRSLCAELGLDRNSAADSNKLLLLEQRLEKMIPEIAGQMPENLQYYILSRYIKKIVCDMIFGYGPLQDLLELPGVSEIMIVCPTQVYIEQYGQIRKSSCTFLGDEALMAVLERIVSPLGRRIDRSTPLVDARLPDGSRVNAIIPPLALKGPCVTIRRFPEEQITLQSLLKWGSLNEQALELLRGVITGRKNVVIAGGTGSGKTTMLNALSNLISADERLVTIEDSAELQLQHEHLVSLETRPQNVEGKGEITIRDLIKNALRMRPDRIIVGECRGPEAFDMLQAMNTGHNGSMTTVHANNPHDTMTRLESMCLMAVDIPLESIRQQISQAVNLVVYIERLPNHQRMITEITEVSGMHPYTGEIITRTVMKANYHEEDGKYHLELNGYIPSFLSELAQMGHLDVRKVFGVETETAGVGAGGE